MTPFAAWLSGPYGSVAVVLMCCCAVVWCLSTRKGRAR